MLWVIFFMTMGYIAVYTNWLPTMFEVLGYQQNKPQPWLRCSKSAERSARW